MTVGRFSARPRERSDRKQVLRGALRDRHGDPHGDPLLGALGRVLRTAAVEGLSTRVEGALHGLPENCTVPVVTVTEGSPAKLAIPAARTGLQICLRNRQASPG